MNHSTAKTLAASLLSCKPDHLINFRLTPDGVITLAPDGRKFYLATSVLEEAHRKLLESKGKTPSTVGKSPYELTEMNASTIQGRRGARPSGHTRVKTTRK